VFVTLNVTIPRRFLIDEGASSQPCAGIDSEWLLNLEEN